jgi:outer membrane protein assembly factor BamB
MHFRSPLLLACFLTFSWPGQSAFFRDHGGVADTASPLPASLADKASLCWRQPLLPGHSSPIIHGSSIYLTTYDAPKQQLATLALDLETGVEQWKRIAPTQRLESTHRTGGPAAATPACDGQRLYVFFGSYGLLCYGLDGTELWQLPMGPFQDEYGAGSSPILADGKVIISQDHDIDSFVMAVDAETGRVLWRTARADAVRSYATPAFWTHQGNPQILVPGALRLTSYDARDGSPIWWVDGLARIVIPAPAVVDDTIYVASWAPGGDTGSRILLPTWTQAVASWDKNHDDQLHETEIADNEVLDRFFRMDQDQNQALSQTEWTRHANVFHKARNGVLAIRPEGRGDQTVNVQWTYSRGAPYVASPLVHHGRLWMVKDGGLVTKLEAATGQLLHQERLPGIGSYYASPICADGKVYFASEQGVVSVVADQRDWHLLSSHDFEERIYATPAILGNRFILRTEAALYCFRDAQD